MTQIYLIKILFCIKSVYIVIIQVMSKSILSFFKVSRESNGSLSSTSKNVNTVNTDTLQSVNNETTADGATNSENTINIPHLEFTPASSTSQYRPQDSFQFPKRLIGNRERRCQHQWFKEFKWLHYNVKNNCVFCYYCVSHDSKLTAEHNKDPAYISTGFRNWKKAPKCFKEHEESKCHKAALTYQVVVPRCGDAVAMNNNEVIKRRYNERQYLKIVMESLQYLARQGIALRGNEDGNDNLTQLLLLRGKDHPYIIERLQSKIPGKKRYTHHDFQDELLTIMSNQLLRKKLYDVNSNKFYSIMCDEYTDISNKEQLSFCVRWVDNELNAHEDFLGYYEIPNIKSDTIVRVIKDSLIRFNLPMCNLRGQTYDGASNMLGPKSGVAKQIKDEQPKALETHCHGHTLSLSVKDTTKSSKLLNNVMGTVGEITKLVKYSPKREKILGSINENIELQDNDAECDYKITSLSKLCVTRWTVRATTYMKVLSNYAQLMKLWEICLQEQLDKEIRSRIVGCQYQMKLFSFFYGIHLGYKLYIISDNLSKTLQKESMSAIEGQRIAQLTLKTFQNMRTDEAADLFFESVLVKASKHEFIEDPVLPRKRKNPDYRSLNDSFQVEGYSSNAEAYHSISPKDEFRVKYFEALDLITASIKSRFTQPSFKAFSNMELFLIQSVAGQGFVDEEIVEFITKTYGDDLDINALQVETAVLGTILGGIKVTCFYDIYKRMKEIGNVEKDLIPNVTILCRLLIVNPATSCTPERSFSTARRLKNWLRSTMTNRRFNALGLLNTHKELTDNLDLAEVGNEFVSLNDERYHYFGNFIKSDFS